MATVYLMPTDAASSGRRKLSANWLSASVRMRAIAKPILSTVTKQPATRLFKPVPTSTPSTFPRMRIVRRMLKCVLPSPVRPTAWSTSTASCVPARLLCQRVTRSLSFRKYTSFRERYISQLLTAAQAMLSSSTPLAVGVYRKRAAKIIAHLKCQGAILTPALLLHYLYC